MKGIKGTKARAQDKAIYDFLFQITKLPNNKLQKINKTYILTFNYAPKRKHKLRSVYQLEQETQLDNDKNHKEHT